MRLEIGLDLGLVAVAFGAYALGLGLVGKFLFASGIGLFLYAWRVRTRP